MADDDKAPAWNQPGMRPTMNGTGFMFEVLDEYAEDFIQYSASIADPVLDLGCAYGVASLPALAGGARVTACDLDQRHLDILHDSAPADQQPRLNCVQGQLPGVNFPDASFGAVLCSRVLHFLDGSAVDASVHKIFRWLKPGGRIYLVADTPYGIWRKYIPVFEAKRSRGDRWPGLMIGLENYLPQAPQGRSINGPPFMNLLDPELLARSCTEAGFEVERAGFIDRGDFFGLGRMDGRENAGVMARKPA
jgi:SAM-dependent methyltransferase